MNESQNLETNTKPYWNENQIGEERYNKIKDGLHSLMDLCNSHISIETAEDALLLESMANVLESLERTLTHHFNSRSGHIVSPKSNEPWD